MARTITEIHNKMLLEIASNEVLKSVLTSNSIYSIFRIFSFIVASAVWVHESMFDQHTKEINEKLANQKAGTLPWYRTMALRFQYGFDLVEDEDYFDNSNATEAQILASKIVKYAAVNEVADSSRVIVKIAGESSGVLSQIEIDEQEAFEFYINEIKFAGVQVTVINYKPDRLYLTIQIQRDPLVLDASGMSILNGNYPVNDAIQQFMKELPFNGLFAIDNLLVKLRNVPGVIIPTVLAASSSWINPEIGDYDNPQPINIKTIPVSGYFTVSNFNGISYVV